MADDFDFETLAKRWQQQQTPTDGTPGAEDLAQASRRQRKQRALMYIEWLGALVMEIAAVWLLLAIPGWLGYLSAAFLMLGALSTFYVSRQVHRPILAYDNWSSSGLLQFRRRTCQLSLRYYRYTQFSCAALILFSALLWLLHWWQPAEVASHLLLFYSVLVSPLCLIAIYQLQQKIRQKAVELQQLSALAKDFEQDH
ncbi:hypothetical protein SAMN06297229_0163 [Pseudidiomarina planktonica]|uniref:Uncharacterized protein n=1 Tax=Pseudidiomarina planktonica TaxID=1323738 RepID=A0A1Y6E7X2_9GAMM|nr:hypothetical protein [Pseudidiomarina planktonica]RUO66337.1 hypothetical protein CWI77_07915 [Pseudidiomarina planktonica]SMQ58737.1 hypothetical protein SAMN06297229_0163 [Pseudidiomarina planktonica]